MRKKAYMLGREMIWSHIAHLYMESFQRARRSRLDMPYKPLAVRTLAEQPMDLPGWRLDHLVRMTDSAGMLQHATSTIPNFARATAPTTTPALCSSPCSWNSSAIARAQVYRLATTYAAFLNYAFDRTREPVPQFSGLRPAAGSRTSARTTAMAEHSGCSGLVSAGRSVATFNSGPHSSLTWHCRQSTKRPRRGPGRSA